MIPAARRWIKAGAARVLSAALPGTRGLPVVIGYHRVVENFPAAAEISIPSMLVSVQMLEQHLDWIGRRYRFVDLEEIGARIEGGGAFDEPVAAVTFDDGYRDFHDLAAPLLRRKGIPCAVFAITGHIGTARVQACDKLYLLLKRRRERGLTDCDPYASMRRHIESLRDSEVEECIAQFEAEDALPDEMWRPFHSMTWEQLDAVHRSGVTVGSHTRAHIVMTNESRERVFLEARESRDELDRGLGAQIRHFAYPSGCFDDTAIGAVAAAGYRFAYTTCAHRDRRHPWLTIPRTLLWENSSLDAHRAFSGAVLNCQVQGAAGFASRCAAGHGQALQWERQR